MQKRTCELDIEIHLPRRLGKQHRLAWSSQAGHRSTRTNGLGESCFKSAKCSFYQQGISHYWLEVMSLAAVLFFKGAAPPPSRKFTELPTKAPGALVEAKPPLKYGRRSTFVPLYVPGARIPGTVMPTFGVVSVVCQDD